MIEVNGKVFILNTKDTTYAFGITDAGHPEHLYYGPGIDSSDIEAVRMKNTMMLGSSVDYSTETPGYSLDNILLEYSGIGKGDYRHTPAELIMPDGSFVSDFVYHSHTVCDTPYTTDSLPTAYGDAKSLVLELADAYATIREWQPIAGKRSRAVGRLPPWDLLLQKGFLPYASF